MKKFLWLSCILSSLAAAAFGVTLYPAGVKTVDACAFATEPLQQIVTPLSYPEDWKIIVACTDGEWQEMTHHFDATSSRSAFTMRDARVTVINGGIFREKIYAGPTTPCAMNLATSPAIRKARMSRTPSRRRASARGNRANAKFAGLRFHSSQGARGVEPAGISIKCTSLQ